MRDYLNKILEKRSEIEGLKDDILTLEKEWIDIHHPLKVGDTVETNYWGYKKMVVDELTITFYENSVWFGANGFCIKKDGSLGKQRASTTKRVDITQ